MITPLGKELRKLRIDREERLLDMAEKMDVSSSFLSAVEMGKKIPPNGFVDRIADLYRLSGEFVDALREAADASRKSFNINPASSLGRDTASLFARRVNDLSEGEMEKINKILRGSNVLGNE